MATGYDEAEDDFTTIVSSLDATPEAFVATVAAAASSSGYETVVFDPREASGEERAFQRHCEHVAGKSRQRSDEIFERCADAFHRDINSRVATAGVGRLRGLSSAAYVMEGMDKKHRMGNLLVHCLNQYHQLKPAQPFFDWLDGLGEYEQVLMVQRSLKAEGHGSQLLPSTVRMFVRGVAYLDQATRGNFAVSVNGSQLWYRGAPLDTGTMRTVFSGSGTAIFVQSPTGVFYTASHKMGMFHHSSFLAGSAVRSAGEWRVSNGALSWVSAKSGHYTPMKAHFVAGLTSLQNAGVLGTAKVRVFQAGAAHDIPATTFLSNQAAWEIWN